MSLLAWPSAIIHFAVVTFAHMLFSRTLLINAQRRLPDVGGLCLEISRTWSGQMAISALMLLRMDVQEVVPLAAAAVGGPPPTSPKKFSSMP